MADRVLVVVSDLMFLPRVAAAAEALGCEVATAMSTEEARGGLADEPAIVVIDVHAPDVDSAVVITAAKAAGAAVLAFGRHTEPATLRAARDAGADRVVPRSQLVEELPALLASLLEPAREHRGTV